MALAAVARDFAVKEIRLAGRQQAGDIGVIEKDQVKHIAGQICGTRFDEHHTAARKDSTAHRLDGGTHCAGRVERRLGRRAGVAPVLIRARIQAQQSAGSGRAQLFEKLCALRADAL